MSKSWANPTWYFFHTLIEKIHPNHYLLVKEELMAHIKKICSILPCPDCAQHATHFMRNVKTPYTKEDCKKMLFFFHNTVNIRIKKPLYAIEGLTVYQRVNLTVCYKLFRDQFTKKTNNAKIFLDSMSRKNCIQELDLWLQKNRFI